MGAHGWLACPTSVLCLLSSLSFPSMPDYHLLSSSPFKALARLTAPRKALEHPSPSQHQYHITQHLLSPSVSSETKVHPNLESFTNLPLSHETIRNIPEKKCEIT